MSDSDSDAESTEGEKERRLAWEKEPYVDHEAATRKAIDAARRPWEKKPHVDREAATKQAILAAQPPHVDTKSAAVASYAQTAFDNETAAIRNAQRGDRQKQLFPSAANLYELVAAGALDETRVYEALRDACRENRLEQDDGEPSIARTLANARRAGFDKPRDLSRVGQHVGDNGFRDETEPEPKVLVLDDFRRLERGFWVERESLRTIYLAALSGMASPWAVLAHCTAIAVAMVPPHITLPPLGRTRASAGGSLNWMALIVDDSGGGKDIARAVAEDLIPIPEHIKVANVGSGEGLIGAFVKPKTDDEPAGVHESITVECNEIDALTVLGKRNGSTLLTVLRSAFAGERLSFTYVSNQNRPALPKHSYRMTVTISAQPRQCGSLLADVNGGTPQRFQWFPANDRRITTELPPWPGALSVPSPSHWLYPTQLTIPYEAIELIRDERVRNVNGDKTALDSHALFVREKFAFALALLDGRATMNSDDWRLAGVAMRVSDHVRAYATQQIELDAIQEAEKQGTMHGVARDAANVAVSARESRRLRTRQLWVLKHLKEVGSSGITEGALRRKARGTERGTVVPTLKILEATGEARQVERLPGDDTARWTLGG